jgi:hypothetical protein
LLILKPERMKNSILTYCLFSLLLVSASKLWSQTTPRWQIDTGIVASASRTAITTDLSGNIYSVSTVSATGGTDWQIVCQSPTGDVLWTSALNGSGNGTDEASGIHIDSESNVYVCGYTTNSSGKEVITLCKLNSAGTIQWTSNYSRLSTANQRPNAITADDDYIYLTGKGQNSNGDYDCAVLKFARSDGSLSWASFFDGTGNGADEAKSVVTDGSGNVYVCGNTTGTTTGIDGIVMKYAATGTKSWGKVFSTNGTDELLDLAVDASGNVYVTGYKYTSSTASYDYATGKINSAGTSQWSATYNGSFSGVDKSLSIILDDTGAPYVTGYSESGTGNTDYLTISYTTGGSMNWSQRYQGSGNAEDEPCSLLLDGTDIVVAGSSKNSSGNYDFTTLSYASSNGSTNWTMRTDGAGAGADMANGVCRDEMSNIYVSGTAYTGSSVYKARIAKYNQLEKNELAIEKCLEMLAQGLEPVRSDADTKQIIYNMVLGKLDSIGVVRYSDLMNACDSKVRIDINNTICSNYSLNASLDWITILLQRMYYQEHAGAPMIYIENFFGFTESDIVNGTPDLAYSYFEDDFPIPSLTHYSGQITQSYATSAVTFAVIYHFSQWTCKGGVLMCGPTTTNYTPPFWQCTPPSTVGGITKVTGSSTQQHEIGILIGNSYSTTWAGSVNAMDYYPAYVDFYPNDSYSGQYYALLTALPGFTYYQRNVLTTGVGVSIQKVSAPIYSVDHGISGGLMTLCNEFTTFNDMANQTYTEDFVLAMGGVYKVTKPGTNLRPLYFSFPYARTIWYVNGPDMNIAYGSTPDYNTTCTNGGFSLSEDYFVGGCEFYTTGQNALGYSASQVMNVLATTDYSTITSYWADNVITLGVNKSWSSNVCIPANVLVFNADNNSSNDCNPQSDYSNLGSLVADLDLSSSGWYSIQEDFIGSATYPAGTQLLVHVVANFTNGEHINDCQTLTLAGTGSYTDISAEIRGDISNYSSSIVNYQIKVYLLN